MASTIPNSMDTISDFVVNKGNGIKGLVDKGLENPPENYILPLELRFDRSKAESQVSIPIIDVSNLNDPKVAESICEAASKWGFFQIINHGIRLEVLEKVKDAAHGFFGLPSEERRKYLKGNSPTDTVFMGTSFSPHKVSVLEWKDYLSFQYVPGDTDEASALWPPVCKDPVLEYMKRAEFLIKRLLEVLLKKLNVKKMDKAKEFALMGSLGINLNYYPKCPNPDITAAVGPHSDISTLTVLLQDEIGGLYARGIEGDSWFHVPPIKGAIVINVGDALQMMSNGKYKSIEHRVVANKSKNRVSVSIFVKPNSDAVIGPFLEALENGEKPIYKEIIYSDYFQYFFGKGREGKKTLDYAKIQ